MDNGLRIKLWLCYSKGFVERVWFLGVFMVNVFYFIFIDQNYCFGDFYCFIEVIFFLVIFYIVYCKVKIGKKQKEM